MTERARRRLDPMVLVRGLPGHPLHPPLTDATIGMYVLAGGLAVIGYAGAIKLAAGKGMWLALIGGLVVSLPTALTGLVDWLLIEWGSARWKTATLHLTAMVSAVVLFVHGTRVLNAEEAGDQARSSELLRAEERQTAS
jgi:uncharacterized membrane protein